jgi:hypothetical protein
MSVVQRKYYCVAYLDIDAQVRVATGEITEAEQLKISTAAAMRLMNKGDNFAYSTDVRRVDAAFRNIVQENPTAAVIRSAAARCEGYLRL